MARTAAALIIGNEILSGKIQDTNLVELARLLRSLGIKLQRVVVVADETATIAKEVSALASSHEYLFTSGGVGPTHDDVTLEAIAAAFGVPIVVDLTLEGMFRDHYGDRINEGHLRLARVPRGTRLVSTASERWPVAVLENVWILPGVPEIFRRKLRIVREHLEADAPFLSRAVFTKMDEASLKRVLDEIVGNHPTVEIGSYPNFSDPTYRTKITFDGTEAGPIERAVDELVALLPEGEPQWLE